MFFPVHLGWHKYILALVEVQPQLQQQTPVKVHERMMKGLHPCCLYGIILYNAYCDAYHLLCVGVCVLCASC